jgi:hypothetical protein
MPSNIQAVTYETAFAVTASDTVVDPNGPFAALQCTGVAGLAKVITKAGQTVTIYLPLGVVVPLAVTQVFASVTTATNIVGMRALPYQGAKG